MLKRMRNKGIQNQFVLYISNGLMKIKWVYTVKKLIVLSLLFVSIVFSFIEIIVGIGFLFD